MIQSGKRFLTVDLHRDPLKLQLHSPNSGSQLRLPLSPLNTLPPRLSSHIVDGKIECIQLNAFLDLQQAIVERNGPIFVEGAAGVGKSFALYHLFCSLSSYSQHRVLYIPDCSILNETSSVNLMQALVAAFSLDPDLLTEIEPYARDMRSIQWNMLLQLIADYCQHHSLVFYAIFDQYEAIATKRKKDEHTDVFFWAEHLQPPHKIIFSASSNNNYEPLEEMEDSTETYWYLGCYTQKELKAWQRMTHFFPKRDLAIVKEYLGTVPQEWTLLNEYGRRNRGRKTLEEVLYSYSEQRKENLVKGHKEWVKKCKRREKSEKEFRRRYRETLIAASAGAKFLHPMYDHQLFYVHPTEHTVTPIIPMTMKIVESIIKTFEEEDWEGIFETGSFQRFPDNASRGKVATCYIVHRIINEKALNMHAKDIQFNLQGVQNKEAQEVCVRVQNLQVQWLHTLLAPLSNPTCNMLYINRNPLHHDVDFFIWDHEKKHLWLFKGAVGSNDPKVFANNWNAPSQQHITWRTVLPHDFTFKMVWIVDADPTIQTLAGQAFILEAYFHICDQNHFELTPFPALKHYIARFEE